MMCVWLVSVSVWVGVGCCLGLLLVSGVGSGWPCPVGRVCRCWVWLIRVSRCWSLLVCVGWHCYELVGVG